ncbi:hypothetical protein TruAng_009231 [Truncatella angustata]|nr:hypothetical protein TruAng_009231 [Truncatella angustata]
MNPTAKLYQTVNAAWREGRLENILERKKELASLHAEIKTLKSNIVTDLGVSEPSINEEIRLILEVLKKLYDDLDFPGQLANEKALARGKSLEQNLVPVGPTLIDPCPQFPLSSTLLPLAAAVAAGSAVVILALSQTPATFAIIREMVLATLDREAIAITDGDSSDVRKELGEKRFAVAVLQNHSEKQDLLRRLQKVNTTVRILSPSSGIPAVFVERGVKSLTAVADHILTSILNNPRPSTFRTPRIVLVEESRTNMLATLLTKAHNGAAESVTSSPHAEELQGLLQGKTITSSDLLPAIIQLNSSQIDASEIQKIARHVTTQQRGVVLCPIRSLDHGIDLMNKVDCLFRLYDQLLRPSIFEGGLFHQQALSASTFEIAVGRRHFSFDLVA